VMGVRVTMNRPSSSIGSMADNWEDDIFSKKNIPSRNAHPELHEKLSKLWEYRKSVSTAMSLALDDDDMRQYDTYQALFNQTNREMHTVMRNSMRARRNPEIALSKTNIHHDDEIIKDDNRAEVKRVGSGLDSNLSPHRPFSSPGERPADKSPYWRDVDSLPLRNPDPLSIRKLKQSYKETDHSFEIFLSYQGVVSPRVVNENFQDEFGFRIGSDVDLNLDFEGRILSRLGVLDDVPIVSGSVIIVMYPIKPPVSGEGPTVPTAKF
jgi:hypothetical protein